MPKKISEWGMYDFAMAVGIAVGVLLVISSIYVHIVVEGGFSCTLPDGSVVSGDFQSAEKRSGEWHIVTSTGGELVGRDCKIRRDPP